MNELDPPLENLQAPVKQESPVKTPAEENGN
jgi:hypothetical protein